VFFRLERGAPLLFYVILSLDVRYVTISLEFNDGDAPRSLINHEAFLLVLVSVGPSPLVLTNDALFLHGAVFLISLALEASPRSLGFHDEIFRLLV
jgi:hypothetical protein